MFIDAIFVKIRDGQVANRPIYVALGVVDVGTHGLDRGVAVVRMMVRTEARSGPRWWPTRAGGCGRRTRRRGGRGCSCGV